MRTPTERLAYILEANAILVKALNAIERWDFNPPYCGSNQERDNAKKIASEAIRIAAEIASR